jgi:lipid-A-disaccharide synthase
MKKKSIKTIQPKKKSKENLLVVCGEHSGDLLGASVLKHLPKNNFEFFGIGGSAMKEYGLHSIYEIESLAVIGFTGILSKYNKLKKIADDLIQQALKNDCKYALLIDYPGFNLHLAQKLKENHIQVIFFVSPQIWAWRFNRIYKIKKLVRLMLLLFPFEKKIYDEFSIPSEIVGHPLASRMREKISQEKKLPKTKNTIRICLMPGSRKSEIHRLLIPILESARSLKTKYSQKLDFVLPNINIQEEEFIKETLKKYTDLKIEYYFDKTTSCLESSDLVIVASGTATLEVCFFEKPMVIVYKLSALTYWIGKLLVRTKHVGLVNILSEKEVCKELIQGDCNVKEITNECLKILTDKVYRNEMIQNLKQINSSIDKGDSGKNAAKAILKLIQD